MGSPSAQAVAVVNDGFSYIDTGYPCKLIVLEYLRLHIRQPGSTNTVCARIRTTQFYIMLIRSKVEKKEGLSCNQPAIAQYGNKQAYKNIVVEAASAPGCSPDAETKLQDLVRHTQHCVMFVVHF